MSNESVCEIMQTCVRICFEKHASDLLRRAAEQTLAHMVQCVMSRMHLFKSSDATNADPTAQITTVIHRDSGEENATPSMTQSNHCEHTPWQAKSSILRCTVSGEDTMNVTANSAQTPPSGKIRAAFAQSYRCIIFKLVQYSTRRPWFAKRFRVDFIHCYTHQFQRYQIYSRRIRS
jgi:hypothetical protein